MKIKKDIENMMNLPEEKSDITTSSEEMEVIQDAQDSDVLEPNLDDDFERARSNLLEILDTSKELVDSIKHVAKQRETARDFEVAGNLLKQYQEMNQQLMDLHKQRKSLTVDTDENNGENTYIDKAVFVGSAADLRKEVRKLTNKKSNGKE